MSSSEILRLIACNMTSDLAVIREALQYCGDDLIKGPERDERVGRRMLELATELDVTAGDIAEQLGLVNRAEDDNHPDWSFKPDRP